MAETFSADHPQQSGWYFATNDPGDPTNQTLGWWDSERSTYTTVEIETPSLLGESPWITTWNFAPREVSPHRWVDRSCDGSWSGPKLWHGPIKATFEVLEK